MTSDAIPQRLMDEAVAWVCEADLDVMRRDDGSDFSISPRKRSDLGMKFPLFGAAALLAAEKRGAMEERERAAKPIAWRWAWKTTGSDLEQRVADPDLYEWSYRHDFPVPSGERAEKIEMQLLYPAPADDARLKKAVEALQFYAEEHKRPNDGPWGAGSKDFGERARAALAAIRNHPEPEAPCTGGS